MSSERAPQRGAEDPPSSDRRPPGPLRQKSFAFSIRILNLARRLRERDREYGLARQLLGAGTAIGALVREAERAESRPDFIHKLHIAYKEAGETEYWLELLQAAGYLTEREFESIYADATELSRLLTAIIRTTKSQS